MRSIVADHWAAIQAAGLILYTYPKEDALPDDNVDTKQYVIGGVNLFPVRKELPFLAKMRIDTPVYATRRLVAYALAHGRSRVSPALLDRWKRLGCPHR
jgi:hypothetical protein